MNFQRLHSLKRQSLGFFSLLLPNDRKEETNQSCLELINCFKTFDVKKTVLCGPR